MSVPDSRRPVADEHRVGALHGLARLLQAGIDPHKALSMTAVDAPPATARRVHRASRAVAAGQHLALALAVAGLLSPAERYRVDAMAALGQPGLGLKEVADTLDDRVQRLRSLRARLLFPALVLLVAAVALPLPALVTGVTSAVAYGLRVCAVLLGLVIVLYRLGDVLRLGVAADAGLRRLLGAPPAPVFRERFFGALGTLLAAGVEPQMAIRMSADGVPEGFRRRLHQAAADCGRGASVLDALNGAGCLIESEDRALLGTGEQAGALPDMLMHRAANLRERRQDREQLLSDWMPRIVYGLVICLLLIGLFSGGGLRGLSTLAG